MSKELELRAEGAHRRLTPTFMRKLSPDLRHELYGRELLSWHENEKIAAAAKRQGSEGTEELLVGLRRRGPRGLDTLIEALADEGDVHKDLIAAIRKHWPETPPSVDATGKRVVPEASQENQLELTGNGEWPFGMATAQTGAAVAPPPPPQEGTDHAPKIVYRMSSRPRGIGLVINNKHFTCGMKDRVGTDRDADSLVKLFIYLGFYTNRYDDLTGKAMHQKLQDVADIDHSRFDCFMVAVLTHGVNGKLYSTDGDLIAVQDITKYFDGNNCPALIGKPKVFLFQACRGGRFDYGVELEATDSAGDDLPAHTDAELKEMVEEQYDTIISRALDDPDETDGGSYKGALPTEADFVLAYATVPGYVSWRNSEYGSWFIKALVDTMYELVAKEHLLDILTEVNRRVAEEFQSKGRNKQIPGPVTMLTRKLFFRPGSYEK